MRTITILAFLLLTFNPDGPPRLDPLACALALVGIVDMPGKQTFPEDYSLAVVFDDKLLERGFTAVPNMFLENYARLGISDAAALLIIHLLRYKWTDAPCFPNRDKLPLSCSSISRKRHTRELRDLGLLFTRRLIWTKNTAPTPEHIGKTRSLEYHLGVLFYNIKAIAESPTHIITLPYQTCRAVLDGYYTDVPHHVFAACRQHVTRNPIGSPLTLHSQQYQIDTVDQQYQIEPVQFAPVQIDTPLNNTQILNKTQGDGQNSVPDLWISTLEALKSECTESSYDIWIAPLSARWNDDRVCLDIIAPNREHRDRLANFNGLISRAVCNAAQRHVTVRYITT